jgi:hypothetical protein
MAGLGKAGNAANVGLFIIAAFTLGFQIWDRLPNGGGLSGVRSWIFRQFYPRHSSSRPAFMCSPHIFREARKNADSRLLVRLNFICPYEWSHEIIQSQAREIRPWIHLQQATLDDVDFDRSHPYLQFRFIIYNGSLYRVFLTTLSGKLDYANQPILGTAKWLGEAATVAPSERNDFVVRYILDDPDDVVRIKNISSRFALHDLKATIEPSQKRIRRTMLSLVHLMSSQCGTSIRS